MDAEMEPWLRAVRDVGFPIVAYGALAYAVWTAVRWVAANIVVPLQVRAVAFLDKLEGNVDKMSTNLETQTTTLQDINSSHESMRLTLEKIADHGCGVSQNGAIMRKPSCKESG